MFSLDHLRTLRQAEIEAIVALLPACASILEIGGGTGEQSAELARSGFRVSAIDLPNSTYAASRIFPITDYDGVNIPFADQAFEVVYSSNVMEHVRDLDALHQEIRRVLKPGGRCIHVLPTPAWRFWTSITAFPNAAQAGFQVCRTILGGASDERPYLRRVGRSGYSFLGRLLEALRQRRHGERGTAVTELWYFSSCWWRRHFESNGFRLVEARPLGLFYTGYMVLGPRLSLSSRRHLAGWLGSACHLFVLVTPTTEAERELGCPDLGI